MVTVVQAIGTGETHTTIASWESNLDNTTDYNSGDDAVGECKNEAFDEYFSINGGTTVGLNSVTLSVVAGGRHDGTAGTGGRIVNTADGVHLVDRTDTTVEWLELDWNGNGGTAYNHIDANDQNNFIARNLVIHDVVRSGATAIIDTNGCDPGDVCDVILYEIIITGSVDALEASGAGGSVRRFLNCTVHKVNGDGSTSSSQGVQTADVSSITIQNMVVTDIAGSGSGSHVCYDPASYSNATVSHNLASDATASGTGSLDNKSAANQYVSTTVGSEDLHLKSGADAFGAGTDLGYTAQLGHIDIDGRNRHAHGDIWDMGADQRNRGQPALLVLGVGV